ncbi:hypothetical protein GCM10010193_03120 [Kitasatospora atroaurantiaca]
MRFAPPAPDTIEVQTGAYEHRILTVPCDSHPFALTELPVREDNPSPGGWLAECPAECLAE